MFNVAIIDLKDIIKYFIKFLLVALFCIAFFVISKILPNAKITQNILSKSYLICIDLSIPGIKQIEIKQQESISFFHKILADEIMPISYLIQEKPLKEDISTEKTTIQKEIIPVPESAKTEVLPSNVKETYTNTYKNVKIRNETDFELTEEMLSEKPQIENTKQVIIYHTHTCESYTPSEEYSYEMTGNYRTTDLNFTVARLGEELKNRLESKGFSVIHNVNYHDYPAYNGSYDRSYNTVSNILKDEGKIDIIFDIHRDAIGDSSYAPTVKIGDEYAAQLLFVIGTNGGGLEHSNWISNLRAAIQIQIKANEKYPGLFKPIMLRNSRYNQNLGTAASIIEVGATGNTLEQCLVSMKYLAEVLEEAF